MKFKPIKYLGLGLALAAGLTISANAQTYTWVPTPGSVNSVGTSGTLIVSGASVTLTFTEASGTYNNFTPNIAGNGVVPVALSSDVTLSGNSTGNDYLAWDPSYSPYPTVPAGTAEQQVADTINVEGDWVRVPEPTTIISAAMLLLPFGASTLRFIRKNRAA